MALALGLLAVLGAGGLLGSLGYRASVPDVPLVRGVDTDRRVVALTFDDGPDPAHTQDILVTLDNYDVRATFFVVGEYAEKSPQLVAVLAQEGHEIANHTQTHPLMDELAEEETAEEIAACSDAIESITGVRPAWYRPPRGALNEYQRLGCRAQGLGIAMWTRCLESGRYGTAEQFAASVAPGDILLLHDGRLDRSTTVTELPAIIEELLGRGYEFVTVSELFELSDTH